MRNPAWKVTYDRERQEWRCNLDPHTTLVSQDKALLESELDRLAARLDNLCPTTPRSACAASVL